MLQGPASSHAATPDLALGAVFDRDNGGFDSGGVVERPTQNPSPSCQVWDVIRTIQDSGRGNWWRMLNAMILRLI
jgi:hypothetical protein